MTDADRREMERFSFDLPALLSMPDDDKQEITYKVRTKNICSGGTYLVSESAVPAGTAVNMDLILPYRDGTGAQSRQTHIDISGTVIRCDETGMAVRFDNKYNIHAIDR